MTPRTPRAHGFTLTELMITVAMVAILASIAIPSYAVYKRKAHRALARTVLTELIARQEAVYLSKSAYASSFVDLNTHPGTTVYLDAQGGISDSAVGTSLYKIDLVDGGSPAVSFVATALGDQAKDTDCRVMSVTRTGKRLPNNDICWAT